MISIKKASLNDCEMCYTTEQETHYAGKQGESMPDGMYTPWGRARMQQELDEGVFWVETIEHGGLLIECEKAEGLLSEKARCIGKHWHNFLSFEQDEDMMVVFYEQPALYPWMEETLTEQIAEEQLRKGHPEYFAG